MNAVGNCVEGGLEEGSAGSAALRERRRLLRIFFP